MEKHKAIRTQRKTIEKRQNNKNDVGLKRYNSLIVYDYKTMQF